MVEEIESRNMKLGSKTKNRTENKKNGEVLKSLWKEQEGIANVWSLVRFSVIGQAKNISSHS